MWPRPSMSAMMMSSTMRAINSLANSRSVAPNARPCGPSPALRRTRFSHSTAALMGSRARRPHPWTNSNRRVQQQRVDTAHIRRRVFELPTFSQQRLIEQDVGEVVEVGTGFQLLHQGVVRVHFQNGLDLGRGLTCLLQQTRQVGTHVARLGDETGG